MYEIYYNQDGRGSDTVTVSRLCDSVPKWSTPASAQPASKLTPSPTPTTAESEAAVIPESTPKISIRPLDRKAYRAGREVIRKIQEKLHHEVVSHRGHLKRVSESESE